MLHYEYNSGSPCLVFVHGIGSNSTIWFKQKEYFNKKGFGILTIDLECHGLSNCKLKKCNVKNSAKEIHKIIKKLGITNNIMIGHSLGSLIIQAYEKKYKENKAIILISSPYGDVLMYDHLSPLKKVFLGITNRIKINSHRHFLDFSKDKIPSNDWLQFIKVGMNLPFQSFLKYTESIIKSDYSKTMKKLNKKVLIITGEKDSLIPLSEQNKLYSDTKNSEQVILKGNHHNIMLDKYNQLNKQIYKFIK